MQQQAHVDDAAGEGEADLSAPSGKVAGSTPSAAVAVVKRILRDEGWGGLFKGLKSALIANGLQSAVYCECPACISSRFRCVHGREQGAAAQKQMWRCAMHFRP